MLLPIPSAPGALTTQPSKEILFSTLVINFQPISFIAAPRQQTECACSSVQVTAVVAISVIVTFFTTLGVTAVLSSVITCCVMKRKITRPPSQPSRAVTQEQPVYEEALASVSREETREMGENVAYGPVVR